MTNRVERLLHRLADVEVALGQPAAFEDQKRYKELTQEHAYLAEVRNLWEELGRYVRAKEESEQLLKDATDAEFTDLIREEMVSCVDSLAKLQHQLEQLLIPPDPNDHRSTILELRAGTGGSEAALFVGDLVRMYKLYSDRQGWGYEHLSSTPSELGGFKEYIMVLSGRNVYRFLRYEAGTHRVQRVPATEAQGRIHTSAATVAVLLEPGEDSDVRVEEKDLRVDTYRSSGAGGQHVNTTDSAVRLTHLPTGIVVYCQEERSQHKNKEKALRLLKAKIAEIEEEKKREAMASTRSQQVGSGDRSERIRTYNFPQNRLTDHRINFTLHSLDRVLEGELDDLILALVSHFHQKQLSGAS